MKPRLLALLILSICALLFFPSCAADGSFDAKAFDTITRTGFEAYDRSRGYNPRYPDRPLYPVGAPFPIYPNQP